VAAERGVEPGVRSACRLADLAVIDEVLANGDYPNRVEPPRSPDVGHLDEMR